MSVFPVAIFSAKCAAKRPSVGSDKQHGQNHGKCHTSSPGGDHDMLVKRTLPSKFEIKTEHNVLFETLRLCADAIRLFQAIDPRLPQVAPLDARMFQVSSINGLLEGLWMIFCFSSK